MDNFDLDFIDPDSIDLEHADLSDPELLAEFESLNTGGHKQPYTNTVTINAVSASTVKMNTRVAKPPSSSSVSFFQSNDNIDMNIDMDFTDPELLKEYETLRLETSEHISAAPSIVSAPADHNLSSFDNNDSCLYGPRTCSSDGFEVSSRR